jgi:hypothetical protein
MMCRDRDEETYEVLITPAIVACPEAVMIRDFSTSAGEQTATCQLASHSTMTMGQMVYALVAIVPYTSASYSMANKRKKGGLTAPIEATKCRIGPSSINFVLTISPLIQS